MTQLNVLRAANYPRMPWKNGGGSTEEITRDAGVGLEGFGWRLSIADIGESGGFSSFAGYQRIITVLQGVGMTLTVDGQDTRALLPLDPFAFSGASQVACTLIDGPIRDFNLIYAPDRYSARLQWLQGGQRFFTQASTVLVFSVADEMRADLGGGVAALLERHDCLQLLDNPGLREVSVSGACCVIELTAI
ncbi:HutD family protein [Pseudomonas chlororaphis]|uniref:HutD/Ves family protein n=1 Tax=Pseudomonas chlororaphis TaxID=587753 RepID=UPI000F58AFA0|nr:HutD family protein [Pseudomonas chlororaphis]AZD77011.1 Stresses-induced protein Ves (HutD) [Pseudomonas chlororaphis subsp. aurantiaca]